MDGWWDTGSFDGRSAVADCMKLAAETGSVAHSTGDCCCGCRQRTEIDRGKVTAVDVPHLPAPTGFFDFLRRTSRERVR
jgi:hypothetical protein